MVFVLLHTLCSTSLHIYSAVVGFVCEKLREINISRTMRKRTFYASLSFYSNNNNIEYIALFSMPQGMQFFFCCSSISHEKKILPREWRKKRGTWTNSSHITQNVVSIQLVECTEKQKTRTKTQEKESESVYQLIFDVIRRKRFSCYLSSSLNSTHKFNIICVMKFD